jgi:hypothetical protein
VHSKAAEQLVSSGTRVWFTPLHYAECTHAVAQQVFHKNLAAPAAPQAYRELKEDRAAGLWIEVEMPEVFSRFAWTWFADKARASASARSTAYPSPAPCN